jgi:predicted DNA-binding transcriptional regulator AlpA
MDRTDLDRLPPLIDVPTAAAVLGIGRTLAYDLIRTDRWPTPVLRVGKLIRIPTAGLRRLLDADPASLTSGTETA